MRFSNILRATERVPSRQALIDTALVAALLPHLGSVSLPMLVYMITVLAALLLRERPTPRQSAAFALIGLVAIAVSFVGSFNFVGLSEFGVFISLVSSLLIYAVSLQRLGGKINFYLILSPMLLLALSYFSNNSILMLFYAVGAIFLFLVLLLWERMRASLSEALRVALTLCAMALPIIVLLFLVFPRISFDTRDFGFRDTASLRTGHDGLMHIGGDALLVPSSKVALEVWFEQGMRPERELYFRGSVLYVDRNETWVPLERNRRSSVLDERREPGSVEYKVTLYPHKKRWLYLMDMPVGIDRKSNFSPDLIATWDEPIDEVFRYVGISTPAGVTPVRVEPETLSAARRYHSGRDPRSEAAMKPIAAIADETERFKALGEWFAAQKLVYTLQPSGIDLAHPVDSFVFEGRRGYCVHFASAFATLARMAGLPSRVVTGYKGSLANAYGNYLLLKEEDAHAWVEVYLEAAGWVRVETTAFASGIDASALNPAQTAPASNAWARANLYVMYVKYVVQEWVLGYNRLKQMELLKALLADMLLGLKFALAFALMVALAIWGFVRLGRSVGSDAPLRAMEPLLRAAERTGLAKRPPETMRAFLKRLEAHGADPQRLRQIDALYHEIRYGEQRDAERLKRLRRMCREVRLKG